MKLFDVDLAIHNFWFVASGLQYTIGIAVVSFFFGSILGFFVALMRMSRSFVLKTIAKIHVSFMRGTPMLVILFILYFGLPYAGIQMPAITCAIIGFSVASSAYISEILRASIEAVDDGQWEAAKSLGLSYSRVIRKIILPQAVRMAIPPLSNVMLDLIKSTSLTAMITVQEVFQNAKIVGGREFDYMTMYIVVAGIYWGICSLFERGQHYVEKKLRLD